MLNSEEARRIAHESLILNNHSKMVDEELDRVNDYIRYSAEEGKSSTIFDFKDKGESSRENKKVREQIQNIE